MTVVSIRKIIFCEGKQSSLDSRLLNRVFESISNENITIVPVGSKFSFTNFISGYFYPNDFHNQKYLIFSDRDFDIPPTNPPQLLKLPPNQPIFLTHRTCIENYLLDANLIHSYWQEQYIKKQQGYASKWGHGDSPGIQEISMWIETSVKELKSYQAVRWALGNLTQISGFRSHLKTTWTRGSGNLPNCLNLPECQQKAKELIKDLRQAFEPLTEATFQDSLDKYLAQFNEPEFWQQKQYLIWFNGKDIQKAMAIEKPQYISLKYYFDWAIQHLDITQHPDFRELETKIQEL